MFKKFLADKRGNIAVIAAISMLPIVAAVGAAVDYSQISRHSAKIQQALDAAALAAGKKLGTFVDDQQLADYSRDFFFANISKIDRSVLTFEYADSNISSGSTILLKARYDYDMMFGGILGLNIYTMNIESLVKSGNDTLEIALVLDNSGSMRNARIKTAKTAATGLVNQIFASMTGGNSTAPVKFSLVPFAGHVNVGPINANASWMDTTGASPVHHENLNWQDNPIAINQGDGRWQDASGNWLTRFTLFDDMDRDGYGYNIRWKGCVESRPFPYLSTDTTPSLSNPETLYVPVFAPDEPDNYSGKKEQVEQAAGSGGSTNGLYCYKIHPEKNRCKKWNDGYKPKKKSPGVHSTGVVPNLTRSLYDTNYKRGLKNDGTPYGGYEYSSSSSSGGSGSTVIVDGATIKEQRYYNNYLKDDNNMPAGILPGDPSVTGSGAEQNLRQDWTWKYLNQSSSLKSSWKGPNAGCTTNPITALTTDQTKMIKAINAMKADGSTNIPLGIAWGWRSLSSGKPFTEGRARGTKDNIKILIVMTDGNNTYYTPSSSYSKFNKSTYGSYGYTKSKTVYADGRLFEGFSKNNPSHTSTNFRSAMDEHMLRTCTNAKADGIKIYSVAFNVPSGSSVKAMLQNCASVNSKTGLKQYFDATGSSDLKAAFNAIGSNISNLRLTR